MSHPARGLLLDVDGTIADSFPHLFAAFRYAVEPFLPKPPDDPEIIAAFGPPERGVLLQLLARAREPAEAILESAVQRFHRYYAAEHAAVRAFPGVVELVEWAQQRGWRIGVLTGKGRRSARFTLEQLGLGPFVDCIVSGDDVERPKPDPEGVRRALGEMGIALEQLVVVGDSPVDVAAGRAAGARTAAVLWGALDADALRRAGATWVVATPAELRAVLERWEQEEL
jgi:HAD superfamily hydrolase (TIGR01509 family)